MKKFIVSTIIALVVCAGPALATTVTDTFYGHVLDTTTGTTNDYNYDFTTTGGSVVGLPFTLTVSADTTVLTPQSTFATGSNSYTGAIYSPPNPFTATLAINGTIFYFDTVNNSMVSTGFATLNSSGFTAGPPPEKSLQLFTYSQAYQGIQLQAINLDLVASSGGPFYLDQQLPPMLLSNGDFTATASFFRSIRFLLPLPHE